MKQRPRRSDPGGVFVCLGGVCYRSAMISYEEPTAEYAGSRIKAFIAATTCLSVTLLGAWMTHWTGTERYPASVQHAAGWLTILVFGAFSVGWIGSAIKPHRLLIYPDRFRVEQAIFKSKEYKWDDVMKIWVGGSFGKLVLLRCSGNSVGSPSSRWYSNYDSFLPSGWHVPTGELAQILIDAKQAHMLEHDREQLTVV